jgi:hypothetical protein
MPSTSLARRGTRRREPSPYAVLRRATGNVRIPVPRVDWSRVRCGEKRVWRTYSLGTYKLIPCPAVIYSVHPTTGKIDTALVMVTETWVEMLGAVSDEAIAEEGFDSRAEFKRYFAERYPRMGYRPLNKVQCFRVRPLEPEDVEAWKDAVWERLYGSFA